MLREITDAPLPFPSRRRTARMGGRVRLSVAARTALMGWISLLSVAAGQQPSKAAAQSGAPGPKAAAELARGASSTLASDELRRLVANLDADAFAVRDVAMQALSANGVTSLPFLIEALTDPNSSAERRLRAALLLARHDSFDQLVPPLVAAAVLPHGSAARELLQQQCLRQVDLAGQLPHIERLFRFWETDQERYRASIHAAFQKAKNEKELAAIAGPLVDLRGKATAFSDLIARLDRLSISNDHRHGPGFIIVEALALGLRENRPEYVRFATSYVESLESLASALEKEGQSRHAVRQELAGRTGWSQGAAAYLIELLDPQSSASQLLQLHIPISTEMLQEGFFAGLASPRPDVYMQGAGRIHIVDLLATLILQWPDAPREGPVTALMADVVDAAREGNKPRALVALEALEACRKLPAAGLNVQDGWGQRLAQRLCTAARRAENHRSFYPAISVHHRLTGLLQRGITPEHEVFPREFAERYLQGSPDAISEAQRLGLERYVAAIERIIGLRVGLDQPGVRQLAASIRPRSLGDGQRLGEVIERLDRLARENAPAARDPLVVDRQLAEWAQTIAARDGAELRGASSASP